MRESRYQAGLIKRLEKRFPGCFIIKLPSDYLQGLPDLLILWGKAWGVLEDKASAKAPLRPNQAYYVALLDEMSFGAIIYPENEEEVLDALQQALTACGNPCVLKS